MAVRITDVSQVPNPSSGIYFREVDLTVITRAVGGFSGAMIGLTEKGPAFQISSTSTFEDRAFRLGDLNPNFPSSYYARQYLEQATNWKEVRILGLEGYTDTVGYAIVYNANGSAAAVPGTSTLVVGNGCLAVVLKARPTTTTGRPAVTSVSVETVTYTDPSTNLTTTAATDYLFGVRIFYADSTNELVICSLRPDSGQYIKNTFGTDPLNPTTIKGQFGTLWVDFVIPSVQFKPTLTSTLAYYAPGSNTPQSTLPILTGNMLFGTGITLQNAAITNVVTTLTDVTITASGDITGWLNTNTVIKITDVSGTGNIAQVNGTWMADNISFGSGSTTFRILNQSGGSPGAPLVISGTTTFSGVNSPLVSHYSLPTWESEILNFSNLGFQTPYTPWFVSDGDANGDYTKLFRLWSISDGKSANTEIKIEIRNINPGANNGAGTFDLYVRRWDDQDDQNPIILEAYINLTFDKTSNNYIKKRIGDGDNFPLNSRFVFVETNDAEDLVGLVPFGCLGYPNTTLNLFPDVTWATEYDKTKSIAKQNLGLANNSINMVKSVAIDQLAYKRSVAQFGLGFHLNPNNNTTFTTDQSAVFTFANQSIYTDANGNPLTATLKIQRQKFVVDFSGGFDGWNVYKTRDWNNTSSKDYLALQTAVAILADKESLDADFTVMVTPDFFLDTHPAACGVVADMVRGRGDALYIPDFSYDPLADTTTAVNYIQTSSGDLLNSDTAVYFPWLQINDTINNQYVWLPPSILALGTIAYTANVENVWQPPAGPVRTVTNNLIRSRRRLVIGDRDALKLANINPITTFPGSGYEITEERTTQPYLSALSFVHNRLLLCYAKKVLNQTLRPLLFQLNGQLSQTAFIQTVTPIFDRIKKLNGIDTYKVEIVDRPELNDPTTLYGRIIIVLLYPIERIIVDFVLQNGSTNFTQ